MSGSAVAARRLVLGAGVGHRDRNADADPDADGGADAAAVVGLGSDAPVGPDRTVTAMPHPFARSCSPVGARPGIVAGIGAARRGVLDAVAPTRTPLAEVVPLPTPPPRLAYPPTTRVIDDAGRFTAKIGGRSVAELCGWPPGPLRAHADGFWQVLTADRGGAPLRRYDGRPSVNAAGRVRLPEPVLYRLGLRFGDEVAVLALADHGAVALCHPARLLLGAPLALLDDCDAAEASR